MKEAAESHFSVFMAVENQPIVEARHEQIPSEMFRVSVTPNRTNVGMVGEQHNGPIHCINKSLSADGFASARYNASRSKSHSNCALFAMGVNAFSGYVEQPIDGRDQSPLLSRA